jgi:hypothetical protein
MKFILFVEGETEKKVFPSFFRKWLNARLNGNVGIQTVKFSGFSEMIKDDVKKKVLLHLNGPGNEKIIAVISILDLYGPNKTGFYPPEKINRDERYEWGKNHMEALVNHLKFHQFFAVHETEAWLFSDPAIFSPALKNDVEARSRKPEEINFNHPPASLLDSFYLHREKQSYKKIVDGMALFEKLDPDTVYQKCPRFRELLDTMLSLAKEAGL